MDCGRSMMIKLLVNGVAKPTNITRGHHSVAWVANQGTGLKTGQKTSNCTDFFPRRNRLLIEESHELQVGSSEMSWAGAAKPLMVELYGTWNVVWTWYIIWLCIGFKEQKWKYILWGFKTLDGWWLCGGVILSFIYWTYHNPWAWHMSSKSLPGWCLCTSWKQNAIREFLTLTFLNLNWCLKFH